MGKGQKHHIMFTRRTHVSQEPTKKIRATPELIPEIEPEPHTDIHREIATVPVLDHFMANRVLSSFRPVRGNTLATMDDLMFAIDEAVTHPKAKVIEQQLGKLVIACIEIQKPFIKEGLINGR